MKIAHKKNIEIKEVELEKKLSRLEREGVIKEFREYYQEKFIEKLKLKIDFVDPGYGRTNTGNNIGVCLKNFEITAGILNIDSTLIKFLNEITKFLYSLKEINLEKFVSLLNKTHDLIRTLYPEISIPPSVHKIIVHSPAIIKLLGLSPGKYSEENSECLVKLIRVARSHDYVHRENPP